MYQHGCHSTDFCKTLYWGLLWKAVEKIQIWLKSDKNIGKFAWKPKHVYIVDSSWMVQLKPLLAFPWQQAMVLYCSQIHVRQRHASLATVITRTCHNMTLHVHCVFCYIVMSVHLSFRNWLRFIMFSSPKSCMHVVSLPSVPQAVPSVYLRWLGYPLVFGNDDESLSFSLCTLYFAAIFFALCRNVLLKHHRSTFFHYAREQVSHPSKIWGKVLVFVFSFVRL
jgi:hypothetical protein